MYKVPKKMEVKAAVPAAMVVFTEILPDTLANPTISRVEPELNPYQPKIDM